MLETVTALLGVFYFACLSKHWFGYILVGYIMQIIGTICVFFVPESPKYLFKKGLKEETAQVLNRIAKKNGADAEVITPERVQ